MFVQVMMCINVIASYNAWRDYGLFNSFFSNQVLHEYMINVIDYK